jgi:hypothetical protein
MHVFHRLDLFVNCLTHVFHPFDPFHVFVCAYFMHVFNRFVLFLYFASLAHVLDGFDVFHISTFLTHVFNRL